MIQRSVQRSIGLLVFLGLLCPMATYAQQSQRVSPEETEVLNNQSVPSKVDIEEQIELDESVDYGDLIRDYTFTGSANDLIVVYWNADRGSDYGASVSLYDAEGYAIEEGDDYSEAIDFSEFKGVHRTFLLPATGTYRLALMRKPADDLLFLDNEIASSYLLRVRVASEYEQLLVSATGLMDNEQWQDALELFSMAIAQAPDQPLPYIGRLFSQAGIATDEANIEEYEISGPEELYALYKTQEPSVQAQIISDLKAFEETMTVVMAEENLTEEELDIELAFFNAIAQYLETGEQPEYLKLLMQDN